MVMLLGKSADQACVTKVIVIVIEYLYSATWIRGASRPGPVSSLRNREIFRLLRNWLSYLEKRSIQRDWGCCRVTTWQCQGFVGMCKFGRGLLVSSFL